MLVFFNSAIVVIILSPFIFFVWMHMAKLGKPNAEALIVLGYKCENNQIHPFLKERLDSALRLLQICSFRHIILSGGSVASELTEAEIMKTYLVNHGVSPDKIILENQSQDTFYNLVNCRYLLEKYNIHYCVFVSNSFHIRRIKYLAKRMNIFASFYSNRRLKSLLKQWRVTFNEVKVFRITKLLLDEELKKGFLSK